MATIANKGVKQQQSIIKSDDGNTENKSKATRVVDEQVAAQMMDAMESVSDSYSTFVKVDGYRMAAKPGTAEVQAPMASCPPSSPITRWPFPPTIRVSS